MRFHRLSMMLMALMLSSCGGPGSYASKEAFQADARYHRDFRVPAPALCEAAQRVLQGDGYVVAKKEGLMLSGGKEFQLEEHQHAILNVFVTCDQRAGGSGSTLYVTATEEHFDVRTSRKSTLIGIPLVAPISIGSRSEGDYQVKIRGETVTGKDFYERFYRAVEKQLPR